MESEENLSLEKQNSEKNISAENSSPLDLPSKNPVQKQSQPPNLNTPDNKSPPSIPNRKESVLGVKSLSSTILHSYK